MATLGTLSAKHLSKTFPGVVALDDVSLDLTSGTVHALVGANGAGKSTLIKILTGFYNSYEGEIELDGQPVVIHTPADAKNFGIEVVHQEVDITLAPSLSIGENLFLEKIANGESGMIINWRKVNQESRRALASVGLALDPTCLVEDLSLHEKQLLVIARAVSHNVRYLILDEPTTSLSLREVDKLFEIIRGLRIAGVGIIYISHRLAEVKTLADEVSVLRHGRMVTGIHGQIDMSKVVEHMLGEAVSYEYPKRQSVEDREANKTKLPILEARGLCSEVVHDVNLVLRRGEIVGITGLVGAGKTELLRLIFGADRATAGEIHLDGKMLPPGHPDVAVHRGIFLVPEERRKQGLFVDATAGWNITVPFLKAFTAMSWMLPRKEISYARNIVSQVGMTPPNPEMVVNTLSGGNQQKVVIGKWIGRQPKVLMFDEATQGIDIHAKHDVYRLAREISRDAGVIFASSEIDEVIGIADRVLVMRDGKVVCELEGASANRQIALEYATGAR